METVMGYVLFSGIKYLQDSVLSHVCLLALNPDDDFTAQ